MDNPSPIILSVDKEKRKQEQLEKIFGLHYDISYYESILSLNKKNKTTSNKVSIKEEIGYEYYTSQEVFDMIRDLNDPEYPLTLEELSVVSLQDTYVSDSKSTVLIYFTPTIPHCSQATIIGLMIRSQLLRYLPLRFQIKVLISKGSHNSEDAINKQLNDKERVAAALENTSVSKIVNEQLSSYYSK